MTLSTDHVFRIGSRHVREGKPCQDYALSGVWPGAAYAISNDGCSNAISNDGSSSSKHTEAGAMLYCMATRQVLERHWTIHNDLKSLPEAEVQQRIFLSGMMDTLGLTTLDMLATNLYAVVTADQGAVIRVRGDGVIALKLTDGRIHAIRFESEGNAPIYPAYPANHFAGWNMMQPALSWEKWECVPAQPPVQIDSGKLTLEEAVQGYTLLLSPEDVAGLTDVAVFSDGVTQVNGAEWCDVVQRLLSFKGTAGVFAIRAMTLLLRDVQSLSGDEEERCIARVSKPTIHNEGAWSTWARDVAKSLDSAKKNKGPVDDIAYAVIHITPDTLKE